MTPAGPGATRTAQDSMKQSTRKQLKQIAHHLDPVIIVGEQGISEPLIAETQRALHDHELIKVKIQTEDREQRRAMGQSLAEACAADIVQTIGKITVLFRRNPEPNRRLSNLSRFGATIKP
jgi:RNA-binding protein